MHAACAAAWTSETPAQANEQTPAKRKDKVSLARIAIGVVVAIVVLIGGLFLVGLISRLGKSKSVATATELATTTATPTAAPAPMPPTLAERLARATTLSEAIAMTKPLMGDVQGEDVNQGAALLAMWWTHRTGLWSELVAMPDTKRAEVMKDPEPWRGRRICMTGSVTQIFRDKSTSSSAPVYMGVLYHNGGFVRFLAVQSTEGIVEQTPARFCGVTIGLQSYPNVSGGTTHAIQVVGLFDIPANGGKGLPQYEEW